MRKNDPAEIFLPVLCATGCNSKWSKWCRGCNLVFCASHIDMDVHQCKRSDLKRGIGDCGLSEKPKKTRRRRSTAPAPCVAPDLPLVPPPNGEAQNG